MITVQLLEKIINLRIKLENTTYKGKKIKILRATNIIKLLYRENNKTHVIYYIDINTGDIYNKNVSFGNINNTDNIILY